MQPVFEVFTAAVLADDVKLGAVAGRQQHRLIDAIQVVRRSRARATSSPAKDDLLAYFDRCRVMVQPEYLQRHTFFGGAQQALMKFEVRMISELNGEFLVCLEATNIIGPKPVGRSIEQFMHEIRRWLTAAALCTLIAFTSSRRHRRAKTTRKPLPISCRPRWRCSAKTTSWRLRNIARLPN